MAAAVQPAPSVPTWSNHTRPSYVSICIHSTSWPRRPRCVPILPSRPEVLRSGETLTVGGVTVRVVDAVQLYSILIRQNA